MTTTTEEITRGARELDDLLQTLPTKVEKNILRSALRAGAAVFLSEVKNHIPSVSGDLRNSARITSRFRRGSVSASVKVGDKKAYYARMVEYGTKPHVIAVSNVDRPVSKRTGKQVSIRTINRSLAIGGKMIGPSVMHPGARPHPYMRPAADAAFTGAVAAVQAKIRERLTKAGLNAPEPIPLDPEQ